MVILSAPRVQFAAVAAAGVLLVAGCSNDRAATDSLALSSPTTSVTPAAGTAAPAAGRRVVATLKVTGTTGMNVRLTFGSAAKVDLTTANVSAFVERGNGLRTVSVSTSVVTMLGTLTSTSDVVSMQLPLLVGDQALSGGSAGSVDPGASVTLDAGTGPVPLTLTTNDTPFTVKLP